MNEAELKALSQEHIRHADKWYRMCAGLSSDLQRYEDGILYLEIHNTERQLPSDYATALKMARSWINGNKELSDAKGFVAVFYKTKSTGFMIGAGEADHSKLESICQELRESQTKEPVLTAIHAGLFTEE
ncbi:hypothetical protein KJ657_03460 [Patescibacteria group bacterium]|nr:hypothetical protein [Patescibacteria group bacterium]MBU1016122.1 hypothetical protein [Patescibacteria group bacterium]MBU1684865.1 hypothetical protein [Patescibacteria group bacterium]MBU1938581.1 hypothetical protein [Patescibacteria group bacterium]